MPHPSPSKYSPSPPRNTASSHIVHDPSYKLEQLEILYSKCHFPDAAVRMHTAEWLDMSEAAVRRWFIRKRRNQWQDAAWLRAKRNETYAMGAFGPYVREGPIAGAAGPAPHRDRESDDSIGGERTVEASDASSTGRRAEVNVM